MSTPDNIKTCFFIAPIGDEGTETRKRSDQILKHIIEPAANEAGYQAIRADKISEPGNITSQIVQHLIDDDLVIADLTGKNPNVFYELAVRHTLKKAVLQIIQSGEPIPFDVATTRTIPVDHRDLDSVDHCRKELIKQIHFIEKTPTKIDSPISIAIDLQSLYRSDNPLEKTSAEIVSMLQELRSAIGKLSEEKISPVIGIPPWFYDEIFRFVKRLVDILEISSRKPLTKKQINILHTDIQGLLSALLSATVQSRIYSPRFLELIESTQIEILNKLHNIP